MDIVIPEILVNELQWMMTEEIMLIAHQTDPSSSAPQLRLTFTYQTIIVLLLITDKIHMTEGKQTLLYSTAQKCHIKA